RARRRWPRPSPSPRPAARTRSSSRTGPGSSSTPSSSPTSTTRCGCSRTAPPAATTSTRPCRAAATSRWGRWPCSTSWASTRRSPSSTRSTRSSATRTTRRSRCCAAWCRPATWGGSRARASTTTADGPASRAGATASPARDAAVPRPGRPGPGGRATLGWMPRLPVPTFLDRAARSGAGPDGDPEPGGEAGADERRRAQITALAASARRAGRGAVASGRWLAETVLDVAPRLPVRDAETLSAHHGGLTGDELARSVVRAAGRVSGGIAATTGGLVTAQQVSVAGLLLVPVELAAVTALVVATEVKLVAELHHLAGRPLPGGPRRATEAAVASWMSGRVAPATTAAAVVRGDGLGPAGRRQLREVLRRRFTSNLSALVPLFTMSVVAAYFNRQTTVA